MWFPLGWHMVWIFLSSPSDCSYRIFWISSSWWSALGCPHIFNWSTVSSSKQFVCSPNQTIFRSTLASAHCWRWNFHWISKFAHEIWSRTSSRFLKHSHFIQEPLPQLLESHAPEIFESVQLRWICGQWNWTFDIIILCEQSALHMPAIVLQLKVIRHRLHCCFYALCFGIISTCIFYSWDYLWLQTDFIDSLSHVFVLVRFNIHDSTNTWRVNYGIKHPRWIEKNHQNSTLCPITLLGHGSETICWWYHF